MLVLELINTSFEARHQYTVDDPKYITIPVVASVFATSLGTVLLFWHFSKIVGAIFFISFIYCVVAHSRFQDRVLRVNRPER